MNTFRVMYCDAQRLILVVETIQYVKCETISVDVGVINMEEEVVFEKGRDLWTNYINGASSGT